MSEQQKDNPRERFPQGDEIEKKKDRIYDDVIAMTMRHTDISPTDIKPETDILYDLGFDSLQIYELIIDLEEGYDIRIPDEELEKIHSVWDVVNLVYTLTLTK